MLSWARAPVVGANGLDMAVVVRVLVFLLIFAAAYAIVQRARAGRDAKLKAEILRLARARGYVDLVDACRSLGARPTYVEALLESLVGGGHLREEETSEGGRRYRLPGPIDVELPPSDTVH